jgi:hypothetical protein
VGQTALAVKRAKGRRTASNRVFRGGEPGARSRRGVLGGADGKEEPVSATAANFRVGHAQSERARAQTLVWSLEPEPRAWREG